MWKQEDDELLLQIGAWAFPTQMQTAKFWFGGRFTADQLRARYEDLKSISLPPKEEGGLELFQERWARFQVESHQRKWEQRLRIDSNLPIKKKPSPVPLVVQHRSRRGHYPLCSQIELSLAMASNMIGDYVAMVYMRNKDGNLREIGCTELLPESLNPRWIKKINVSFHFGEIQTLVFRVYNVLKLKNLDFLGEETCVLSKILTRPNRAVTLSLSGNVRDGVDRRLGILSVNAQETVASKTVAQINFRLDNKDLFSKSDPFLRISRVVESSPAVPICRTEVLDNKLNPMWRPVCLTMQQFGSKDTPLVIECFDFKTSGKHELIGMTEKSVAELERLCLQKEVANFVYPTRSHGGNKVPKGQLIVDHFVEKSQYSFLDYISSGFELNFMVAVDFTASNGVPGRPSSLHHIDPSGRVLNSYQQAIMEVGEVIQSYDSEQRFPAWGFGGKTSDDYVSHAFNLNGASHTETVVGVKGIMAAYASALRSVTLAGPTLFSHVVEKAAHLARLSLSRNSPKYFVLLIITDGVLKDMEGTRDALVRASTLPLSVLIVGVGSRDFSQIQELLDVQATRVFVQFVQLKETNGGVSVVLDEVPGQFVSYFGSRNINPVGV